MSDIRRTFKERIVDMLLLLYVIKKFKPKDEEELQSVIFLIERQLNKNRIKAFNYTFKKSGGRSA